MSRSERRGNELGKKRWQREIKKEEKMKEKCPKLMRRKIREIMKNKSFLKKMDESFKVRKPRLTHWLIGEN